MSESGVVGDRSFYYGPSGGVLKDIDTHCNVILGTVLRSLYSKDITRQEALSWFAPVNNNIVLRQYEELLEEIEGYPELFNRVQSQIFQGQIKTPTLFLASLDIESGPLKGRGCKVLVGKALASKECLVIVKYSDNTSLKLFIQPDPRLLLTNGINELVLEVKVPKTLPPYQLMITAQLKEEQMPLNLFPSWAEIAEGIRVWGDSYDEEIVVIEPYEKGLSYKSFLI
ncbi:MAG: hypothetical protein HC930_03110 [Hydrococcus sp. SU_1_0]|nr:hypothetical protein [Hydrococcus sp. SU_1_0]